MSTIGWVAIGLVAWTVLGFILGCAIGKAIYILSK